MTEAHPSPFDPMSTNTSSEPWPPADCPSLAWPALADQADRLAWYRAVITAYALLWEGHVTQARFAPVTEQELAALESRLGCRLPPALRAYHRELGALSLAETLCSVSGKKPTIPIAPLLEAYPGVVDRAESEADMALAQKMVAFGDYLGNGNMFCFHRATGEVYYFDHDSGAMLTRFFPSPEDYLDALMIRCLAEIHEDDETGEQLLIQRHGKPLVEKWLY